MPKPNIIRYWSFVSQYTYPDGHVDYTLKMTDLVGVDYYVSGSAPAGTDMAALAQQKANEQAALVVQQECDYTTNDWTWLNATDPIVFPAETDLNYADRADVAAELRGLYQPAINLALLNYACALTQMTDAELMAAFTLSDVTELKQRVNRQNAIRTQLANETGE